MKGRGDHRLPVLLLTCGLVGGLGLAFQFWSEDNRPDTKGIQPTAVPQPLEPPIIGRQKDIKDEIAERFQQGVMMLHAGQHDFAVTAFRRVLELSPEMPEAHVNMGFAQLGQGHYAVARDFFRSAIELRPEQVNAYWGLAVSLEALCDLPGAIGAMRSYVHLAEEDDPYQRKAQSALWEWESGKTGGDCDRT